MPSSASAAVAAVYDAAADFYDHSANSFWARFGRRTIERLALQPGERVLDVCCGSGASALAAARQVGPSGLVLGVDVSEGLLRLARAGARRSGLRNARFRARDMLDLRVGPGRFDAVVCVFGIFFVPDMAAAARALWRLVRPGGRLAITTWGPRLFEPAAGAFWEAIREIRPDLYRGANPWDRLCDPHALAALLRQADIEEAAVIAENGAHPLPVPENWWKVVLGSGYRGTVERLDPAQREYVRAKNLRFLRRNRVPSIETNVVYALAGKPSAACCEPGVLVPCEASRVSPRRTKPAMYTVRKPGAESRPVHIVEEEEGDAP